MAILSKLLVALGLDASDYQRGLDQAERDTASRATRIGAKLEGIGKGARNMGLGLTAGVTVPIAAVGAASINAASDLDESMNKVSVVFGDAAASVIGFSEDAATALGQSQQQALEAAGTYGNLFVSMGLGEEAAATMSTGLVALASDLASFNNALPDEALQALRAGLTGEAEPLKRFGVNLNAAAIGAKALELGLADVSVDMTKVRGLTLDLQDAQGKAAAAVAEYGQDSAEAAQALQKVAEVEQRLQEAQAGTVQELTAAQKAQAAYAIIMEQTATAQGDFARTSDGLANATRIAKAQLSDAAATMGQQLLPVALKVVTFVNDLIGRFRELSPDTQKVIVVVAGLAAAIGPLLMVAGTLLSALGSIIGAAGAVGGALGAVAGILTGPVGLAIAAVVGAVLLFKAAWDNNWFGIRDTLIAIWENTLKPALGVLVDWFKKTIPVALDYLASVWNDILLPAIRAVWSFIDSYIMPILGALVRLGIAILKKELEILAGVWENVVKPALEVVWAVIQNSILPIFSEVAGFVKDTLGPVFQWLNTNILGPVAGAFDVIAAAVAAVVGWINSLITAINNLTLPDWLTPDSPPPLETGLRGIGDAAATLAGDQLPSLARALGVVGRAGAVLSDLQVPDLAAAVASAAELGDRLATLRQGGGALAGPRIPSLGTVGVIPTQLKGAAATVATGDHFEIHNHDRASAAVSWAMVDDRRRRRLGRSMGG